jgi:predicted nucleic acid-binding protein
VKKIHWNSCILIYRIQQISPWAEIIARKFAPQMSESLLYSTHLARLECRVLPLREGNLDLLALFDKFFAQPEVVTVPLDARVFNLATELRALDNLKTPDALHLAAAISSGCDEFWSNDDHLAKIAGRRIEVVNVIASS